MESTSAEYITLIAFPDLKDAMPYALALSEAGIEHRVTEQFRDFDPTFADNRRMDQVKVEVLLSAHEAALQVIENIDAGADLRVLRKTEKSTSSSKTLWMVSTLVLLLSTLYFANRSEQDKSPVYDDPIFYYNQTLNSVEKFRIDTKEQILENIDEDGNGIFEKGEIYDRNGELNSMWFDRDQDGVIEEQRTYDRLGRWASTSKDNDGDGYFEEYIEHRTEGDIKYIDTNGDAYYDTEEIISE